MSQPQQTISVSDVYVTHELDTRAPKPGNPEQQKNAIIELSLKMLGAPGGVLPRFVELAMNMTGSVTAGLSILENPDTFYWRHVHGTFAPFEGAETPRDFSPCGVTLDAGRPTLTNHPERVYDWIAAHNLIVPEVLLVPLHVGSGEQLGTLWLVSEDIGHFDGNDAHAATELAGFVAIALRMQRTQEELERKLEDQKMLAREMSHRVSNMFALTDGIVRLTGRSTATKEEMVEALSGRIRALLGAHSLARRSGNGQSGVLLADLEAILRIVVLPHEGQNNPSRFLIGGPLVPCGEHALNSLSLIFHELATNAMKYGALQSAQGHVDIGWHVEGGTLHLQWHEHGGPALDGATPKSGLGTKMLDDMVVRQFYGKIHKDWNPEGLAVTLDIPVGNLTS